MKAGRALVAVAVVAAAIGTAGGIASAAATDPGQEESELLNADSITVTVELRDDGAAEWSIQYKYRLDAPNRTRGFERLRDQIQAEDGQTSYAADVRRDVQRTVDLAENDTGRTMTVGDVAVDAHRQTIPQDFGVVVHRFTWHGFAATDGPQLRAGDAIRGFWLRPRTELRFEWPSEYRSTEVEPEPDETDASGATWENPDFGVEEPSLVLSRESTSGWTDVAGPGLLLFTVVGALALFRHRDTIPAVPAIATPTAGHQSGGSAGRDAGSSASGPREGSPPDESETALDPPAATHEVAAAAPDRSGSAPDGTATASRESGEAVDTVPTSSANGTAAARDGAESAGAASDRSEPSAPLSNEEQLRRVLDRNDGRVKQQTVADACEWSASKTSRVVRSLEEEGVVDVFRIGRENVVSSTEDDLEDV